MATKKTKAAKGKSIATIQDFVSKGGVISSKPVVKTIKWEHTLNGEQRVDEYEVGVIRPAFEEMEKIISLMALDKNSSHTPDLISMCIRLGENFDSTLTVEQARRLEPNLAFALVDAIKSVNKLDDDGKK
jgi:hypothetical protein